MKISPYISRVNSLLKTQGVKTTLHHICRAGTQRIAALPVRLERQYNLRAKLPSRIEKVKAELLRGSDQLFQEIRANTLAYIESNHKQAINVGAYSYKNDGPPILYASCYAALTRHLYNDLAEVSGLSRHEWIRYIQGFQTDDGLFRDPVINIQLAEEVDWWGWRHLTLHALMALTSLGAVAERPFTIIEPFKKKGFVSDWMSSRRWHVDPASVSNEIQNYATLLQYARDFQQENWCGDALHEMYEWLDKTQDPKTGLWGTRYDDSVLLSNGVQTGYHLWLLYFYDRRPIQYVDRIIDSCLKTQNLYGGFGVPLNSSACEDIDSIDPLIRLSLVTDYRKTEIMAALKRTLPWILVNMNLDGGWVFRRYEAFQYGHPNMLVEREESAMFPTWFRTLTLANLAQYLIDSYMPYYDWRFFDGPGHQFWRSP